MLKSKQFSSEAAPCLHLAGGVPSMLAACNGIQLLSRAEAAPSACSLWTGSSHPLPSCLCPLLTHLSLPPGLSGTLSEVSQQFINVNGKFLILNREGWNNRGLWANIYRAESVQREIGS